MGTLPDASFGRLLKRLRESHDLTQEALAEQAGYSAIYIRKLEHGDRIPMVSTMQILADALNLTPPDRGALEKMARMESQSRRQRKHWHNLLGQSPLPLIGQDTIMSHISACLEESAPPLLLLSGDPGIGKTRLLQAALDGADQQHYHLLAGACYRQTLSVSYMPFPELLTQLLQSCTPPERRKLLDGCSWLTRLMPEIPASWLNAPAQQLPYAHERQLMFSAVAHLLTHLAASHRLLLVLDDLQWANADTLALLAYLVRAVQTMRLIATYRDTEVARHHPLALLIADLMREGRLHQERIAPLSEGESLSLLRQLRPDIMADIADPIAIQLHNRSAGIPLYMVSWAQTIAPEMTLGDHIPESVAESIDYRLSLLPPEARHWAEVVAIAGQDVDRDVLYALGESLGQSQWETVATLDRLCQAHILVEVDGQSYGFAHDLIHDVVESAISSGRRAILHREVARLLEQRDAEHGAQRIASHYYAAGAWEQATAYLERAGDQASERYATAEAEQVYRYLLEAFQRLHRPADEALAQVKLAEAIGRQGRFAEASQLLETACQVFHAHHDRIQVALATSKRAMLFAEIGRLHEGLALLTPLFASQFFASLPEANQASLLQSKTNLLWYCGEYEAGMAAATEALTIARRLSQPDLVCRSVMLLARHLVMRGEVFEAMRLYTTYLPHLESVQSLRLVAYFYESLSVAYELQGDIQSAHAYLGKALDMAQQLHDNLEQADLLTLRGLASFRSGNWSQSQQDFETALAIDRQFDMPLESAYPLLFWGYQCLAQGDKQAAWERLNEAASLARKHESHRANVLLQGILAEIELLDGHPERARARLSQLRQRHSQRDLTIFEVLPLLAQSHIACGEVEEANGIVTDLLSLARDQGLAHILTEALTLQAVLSAYAGHWAEAERTFASVFSRSQTATLPYIAAKSYYAAGKAYLRGGRREQAQTMFQASSYRFNQLGERWYALHVGQAPTDISNEPGALLDVLAD